MRSHSLLAWMLSGVAACSLIAISAADFYYKSSRGEGCAGCHEIRPNFVSWQGSTHRKLNCTDCHASSIGANLHRVTTHFSGQVPEQIHLQTADVFAMGEKCRGCHQQEFAQWGASRHATTYARVFADAKHNQKRRLMDDCLRCHGMHYEGPVSAIVSPVDIKGPWKMQDPGLADRPAIPCLACHAIHRSGEPVVKAQDRAAGKAEINRPSLGLFDRRSRMNIRVDALPLPAIYEGTRLVRTSPDRRQALCYQCHAPLSPAQAGSGDDRTPTGVHEGISCLACHQKHSQNTRQSCAECHPRLSNCGLDVEAMDTTFTSLKSLHNIHSVNCIDCHPKGVPKKRGLAGRAAGLGRLSSTARSEAPAADPHCRRIADLRA